MATAELDLSGAHFSYGDFEEATFQGMGTIKLDGAGLAHADLSGSKLIAASESGEDGDTALIPMHGWPLAEV